MLRGMRYSYGIQVDKIEDKCPLRSITYGRRLILKRIFRKHVVHV